ncbi:hypothetical protein Leryth_003843 [Lithospermum erythrorhizon]|nr:hypothetical protein Leryth_003843 [Lithospermum erythrorhizon]
MKSVTFVALVLCLSAGAALRKNSWQDGTAGTMCPIAPGTNYTTNRSNRSYDISNWPVVCKECTGGIGPPTCPQPWTHPQPRILIDPPRTM